ncbi:MAG: hypothetical protein K2H98_02365, partial [Duncaniella sp.]|nr:hypothetical protein [Duncaniella sp.]
MNKFYFISLLSLLFSIFSPCALARSNESKSNPRKAWNVEMQSVKTDYIARKLDLTSEQKEKFSSLYTNMENEIAAVNAEARKIIDEVKGKGKAATDEDYLRGARAAYEVKTKEGEIENKYFPQLKKILTPAQLFELKSAEMQFTRELIKKHR